MANTFYADVFSVAADPWNGSRLSFGCHTAPAKQPGPNQKVEIPIEEQCAVGMTLPHLKMMAFMLTRYLIGLEHQRGTIDINQQLFRDNNIDVPSWGKFWGISPNPSVLSEPVKEQEQ